MQTEQLAVYVDAFEKILASSAILLPASWALWGKLRTKWGYMSWRSIDRAVMALHTKMETSSYRPSCIVCIGRAGAIVGALLSERFGRPVIPVVVLAFDYLETPQAEHGRFKLRQTQYVDFGTIRENVGNVLLLGIDVVTGSTMEQAAIQLQKRGVSCSATGCLFWHPDAQVRPTFFVAQRTVRTKYPWNMASFHDRHGLGK